MSQLCSYPQEEYSRDANLQCKGPEAGILWVFNCLSVWLGQSGIELGE